MGETAEFHARCCEEFGPPDPMEVLKAYEEWAAYERFIKAHRDTSKDKEGRGVQIKS